MIKEKYSQKWDSIPVDCFAIYIDYNHDNRSLKTKSIINKATTGPREPTDSKAPTIEKNQTCLSTRRTSSQDTQAQGSFRKCFTLAEDK